MVAKKVNGAWGLNNLIWPIAPLLHWNSLLTESAALQIALTHAQTVACQPSTHDLWRVYAACQTSCRKCVLGFIFCKCEYSGGPNGLRENTDEAALFHPYQLGASQSKGFEMSFTLACWDQRSYNIAARQLPTPSQEHSLDTQTCPSICFVFEFFTLFFSLCEEQSTGSACNFTCFPLGRHDPIHSQAIFWTVI